jgi:hypothetical protein
VKLISKVLALRLAPMIDGLVSNARARSSRGDAYKIIMCVRNLARAYHRKKIPALLLKLDIIKAFDSVSWE